MSNSFASTITALAVLALAPSSLGCSSSSSPSSAAQNDASTGGDVFAAPVEASADDAADAGVEASTLDAAGIVAARPYTLHVPTGYVAGSPTPLVVMFHGYGVTGATQEAYFQLTNASDEHTYLYAYGDGTLDQTNSWFWNATDACCDLYDVPVDDVQWFDAVVQDISSKYTVDPKRIFVVGHSNGGFMSHRLACDRSSTVAAIFSLAGAQWDDLSHCEPTDKVSVVEIHGNADTTIDYDGGMTSEGTYPGAPTTVADWATRNGCTGPLAPNGQTYTIDTTLPPNQTVVQTYGGCPTGIDVELWTINGGTHIPTLNQPAWGEYVWGFLSAHPKP
ncbi:MAG: PHB depolymerase family esterase [Polyangiaceae bacterium]